MGKSKKKKYKLADSPKRDISVKTEVNTAPDPIKDAMLKMFGCNSQCVDDFYAFKFGNYKYKREWKLFDEEINYLVHNIPAFSYVTKKLTNLKFSNGITCFDDSLTEEKNKENDKRLQSFLYAKNIEGVTNYSVIQEAFEKAPYKGRAGIRLLNKQDGLVYVEGSEYAAITQENESHLGVYETPFYLVSTNHMKLYDMDIENINLQFDIDEAIKDGKIYDKENELILISKENFLNIRDDLSSEEGTSIFEYDQQRVKLLLSAYLRMNYDIEYDGPGRILLRLKNGYDTTSLNPSGTGEVIKNALKTDEARLLELNREIKGILDSIKKSGSANVIALSNIFEKDITHLPRTVNGKDFLEWCKDMEGEVVCNLYGIDPILMGFGEFSGNISMESKIDQEMLNGIVPHRERQMVQLAPMLMKLLDLPKVYFDKYALKQNNDDSIEVLRLSQSLKIAVEAERGDLANIIEEAIKSKL